MSGVLVAHGIGGRADLPVPLSFFVVGAGVALILSFLAVSALWREPRLQTPRPSRQISVSWLPGVRRGLAVLGVVAFALVIVNGLAAGDETTLDIGPPLVWVYFWLVIPFLAAAVGNMWPWISPWRTLSLIGARNRPERTDIGDRLGVWPASAAFLAFTWLELVSPDSGDPGTLAVAAIVYASYMVALTRIVGPESALGGFDAFEVYNGLLSSISPLSWTRRRPDGPGAAVAAAPPSAALEYRGWLRTLAALKQRRGLTAFIVAMIGTVTYDGMSSTQWWNDLYRATARDEWFGTRALIVTVLLVGGGYWVASWVAAQIAGGSWTAGRIAASFAHTLVPIALAYAVAHYFTLVLFEGQLLVLAASDPFGLGWNLFGTAGWSVSFFMSPEAVWYVQLAVIVGGHIAGVALAHDRALALFGDVVAVRTQYAMLVLMVGLTSMGLFILAG